MTEDLRQIIERIEKLEKAVFDTGGDKRRKKRKEPTSSGDINFSLNERAFVRRYAASKSGSRKFTLLVAYLASGKLDKNIKLTDIRTHWNRMSAKNLLGKFNMFFPSDAKTRGWVDSKEYGMYNLTKEWKDVL